MTGQAPEVLSIRVMSHGTAVHAFSLLRDHLSLLTGQALVMSLAIFAGFGTWFTYALGEAGITAPRTGGDAVAVRVQVVVFVAGITFLEAAALPTSMGAMAAFVVEAEGRLGTLL